MVGRFNITCRISDTVTVGCSSILKLRGALSVGLEEFSCRFKTLNQTSTPMQFTVRTLRPRLHDTGRMFIRMMINIRPVSCKWGLTVRTFQVLAVGLFYSVQVEIVSRLATKPVKSLLRQIICGRLMVCVECFDSVEPLEQICCFFQLYKTLKCFCLVQFQVVTVVKLKKESEG